VTNVLIRGLSDATVTRIDRRAQDLGLSRNEYLRRRLEGDRPVPRQRSQKRAGSDRRKFSPTSLIPASWLTHGGDGLAHR